MSAGGANEPNLTPFIDLFSVLICFLLMTAAWIQLESMPSNIEKATASDSAPTDTPPPKDEKKVQWTIEMEPLVVVLREGDKAVSIPYVGSSIDRKTIERVLAQWKKAHPKKSDVILNTKPEVLYGEMIRMYDILVSNNLAEVGINPR